MNDVRFAEERVISFIILCIGIAKTGLWERWLQCRCRVWQDISSAAGLAGAIIGKSDIETALWLL